MKSTGLVVVRGLQNPAVMKLTVAIVALTFVAATFAARRSHPARSVTSEHALQSFDAFAQNVRVDVGEASTTITVHTPRGLGSALDDW